MLDNKDYISRLNKARRKRNRRFDPTYLLIGLAVILVLALLIGGDVFLSRRLRPVLSGEGQARDGEETETVMQTEDVYKRQLRDLLFGQDRCPDDQEDQGRPEAGGFFGDAPGPTGMWDMRGQEPAFFQ